MIGHRNCFICHKVGHKEDMFCGHNWICKWVWFHPDCYTEREAGEKEAEERLALLKEKARLEAVEVIESNK